MEKTLTIDGRAINFKCTGGTLMRYRNQFGSEFFADLASLSTAEKDPSKINFSVIENMTWVLAKTADSTIPDPQAWFDSFEEIDIFAVWAELSDLVSQASRSLTKNAEKAVRTSG